MQIDMRATGATMKKVQRDMRASVKVKRRRSRAKVEVGRDEKTRGRPIRAREPQSVPENRRATADGHGIAAVNARSFDSEGSLHLNLNMLASFSLTFTETS